MYKFLLSTLLTVCAFTIVSGQSYSGDWEGTLDLQGQSIKLIYHISEDGGNYSATLDSPDQGARGLVVDKVSLENGKLMLTSSALGINYQVSISEDGEKLSGTFKQGPLDTPLVMIRSDVKSTDTTFTAVSDHPLAGSWNGKISVMGQSLRLTFHIDEKEGVFTTKMDSPDQGAYGLEVESTEVQENDITLSATGMGLTIKGTYNPDSNLIHAEFSQGPVTTPIKLTREEVEKEIFNRPQEPKDFPYVQKEVVASHPSGSHTLSGTLTIPEGKFSKVAVLVSGSGPQDRNEELAGHKPFLVLSDYLTRNGIAVMRYDDRGVGKSTGEFSLATSYDFTEDAVAVVNHVSAIPEMKGKKIGIIGHSEGGLIGPIAHSMRKLDFIVMLAGPGMNSKDLLLDQVEAISRAEGEDESSIARSKMESSEIFNYIVDNPQMDIDELKKNLGVKMRALFDALSEEEKEEIGDTEALLSQQLNSITTPWFRYFMAFDPTPYLEKVDCPLLAINGEKDTQVLPEPNISGIQAALTKAGNKSFTTKVLPGLNHLFQVTETGAPSEYGTLEETFNEDAMKMVVEWLHAN